MRRIPQFISILAIGVVLVLGIVIGRFSTKPDAVAPESQTAAPAEPEAWAHEP